MRFEIFFSFDQIPVSANACSYYREAKLHVHPKDLVDAIPDFGEVVMIRINCTGGKVSLTIANSNLIPSPFIHIWDTENDSIVKYQFEDTCEISFG